MVLETLVQRVVDNLPVYSCETGEVSQALLESAVNVSKHSPKQIIQLLVDAAHRLHSTAIQRDGLPWIELERSQLVLLDLILECILSSRDDRRNDVQPRSVSSWQRDIRFLYDVERAQRHVLPNELASSILQLAKLCLNVPSPGKGHSARLKNCVELYRCTARFTFVRALAREGDKHAREYVRLRLRACALRLVTIVSASNWGCLFEPFARAIRREASLAEHEMPAVSYDHDLLMVSALSAERIRDLVTVMHECLPRANKFTANILGFSFSTAMSNFVRHNAPEFVSIYDNRLTYRGLGEVFELFLTYNAQLTYKRLFATLAYLCVIDTAAARGESSVVTSRTAVFLRKFRPD